MKRVNIYIKEEAYDYIKKIAPSNHRTVSGEISFILENYVEQLESMQRAQPGIYIPPVVQPQQVQTQPQLFQLTQAQAQAQPDISSMNGLELQEYARKLSAEAKTKITQEKAEAKAEAKQLTPEEEEMQKQKLELQKQRLQEKRDKAIRDRAIELDLYNAENYTEDILLFNYYGDDYFNSKYNGTKEKYMNKPLEDLYNMLKEVRSWEDQEEAEERRREALPHDIDEWDYKSEDFEDDLRREEEAQPDGRDDPDYIRIKDYYSKHCYYNRLLTLIRRPYAFSEDFADSSGLNFEDEYRAMKNVFNRDKIDEDYIIAVLSGDGDGYREEHKCLSYSQEIENERKELESLIKNKK